LTLFFPLIQLEATPAYVQGIPAGLGVTRRQPHFAAFWGQNCTFHSIKRTQTQLYSPN